MNTARKGTVRCIVFRDGDTWYGAALEFNIVEEADDYDVVMNNLQEAIEGYVESQKKIKGSFYIAPLNQKASKEYEEMWNSLISDKPIPSPIQVRYYGITKV